MTIYIVCNNDILISATFDENKAKATVERLKSGRIDFRAYYHYRKVKMMDSDNDCKHANTTTHFAGGSEYDIFCNDCGKSISD